MHGRKRLETKNADPGWAGVFKRTVARSVFVLVEEEILLGGIVRPDVLDGIVGLLVILDLLKVFHDLERSARTHGEIDQFVLRGGPRRVFEIRGKFKCPIHGDVTFRARQK